MNKTNKILEIICCIGIILLAVGLFITKKNLFSQNSFVSNTYEEHYFESSSMTDFDISEFSEKIIIKQGDSDKLTIKYYTPKDDNNVTISETNGLVTYQRGKGKITISFSWNFDDTSTVVTLPQDFDGSLKTSVSSGAVQISSVTCSNLFVKATSGSVHCEEINCDNLTVEATSGSVKLANVTTRESVFETSSGSVKLENVSSVEKTYISATSGNIQLDQLSSDTIYMQATSGSIKGTIRGKEKDYSIHSKTSSGSCNLKDSKEGTKTLDSETTSGSIKITFTE